MKAFSTSDKVKDLIETEIRDLLANNIAAIVGELYENPDGKLSIGIAVQLKAVKERVYSTVKLSYARKFSDTLEESVAVDDPNQPKLDLPEVKAWE